MAGINPGLFAFERKPTPGRDDDQTAAAEGVWPVPPVEVCERSTAVHLHRPADLRRHALGGVSAERAALHPNRPEEFDASQRHRQRTFDLRSRYRLVQARQVRDLPHWPAAAKRRRWSGEGIGWFGAEGAGFQQHRQCCGVWVNSSYLFQVVEIIRLALRVANCP